VITAGELGFTTLTTPQAPWTPTCRQNAPAARALNDDGRIHRGIKTANEYPVFRIPA